MGGNAQEVRISFPYLYTLLFIDYETNTVTQKVTGLAGSGAVDHEVAGSETTEGNTGELMGWESPTSEGVTVPVDTRVFPDWLLDGLRSRVQSESPAPEVGDRIVWDANGTMSGGLDRSPLVNDRPWWLSQTDSPGPVATEATEFATQPTELATLATELATQATERAIPNSQAATMVVDTLRRVQTRSGTRAAIHGEDLSESPRAPTGLFSLPSATGATVVVASQRAEAQQVGHRFLFRNLRSAGPGMVPATATGSTIVVPTQPGTPRQSPRRETQPISFPWGSETIRGSRSLVSATTRRGNGRQERVRESIAVLSPAVTQPGTVTAVADTQLEGRDDRIVPMRLRPRRVAALVPSFGNPRAVLRRHQILDAPLGGPVLVADSQSGVADAGVRGSSYPTSGQVQDGSQVGSGVGSYVAGTGHGASTGAEALNAAPDWARSVSGRQIDATVDDAESITSSMEDLLGNGGSGRKRKHHGLESGAPRWPCITIHTQWRCGHNAVTSVTHSQRCGREDQVGRTVVEATMPPVLANGSQQPGNPLCPDPQTRMVLAGGVCPDCSPEVRDGPPESVTGWVSEVETAKRQRTKARGAV